MANVQVVPKTSAVVPGAKDVEPIRINRDHIEMVKFKGLNDEEFEIISHCIANRAIKTEQCTKRWERWEIIKRISPAGSLAY